MLSNMMRPRYSISAGRRVHYQRPPFRNIPMNVHGSGGPCTRFIGLAEVGASKEKSKKWIHALSITPIIYSPQAEVDDMPGNVTDNPYADINMPHFKRVGGSNNSINSNSNSGHTDSEPLSKRSRFDPLIQQNAPSGGGAFFFGSRAGGGLSTGSSSATAVGQLNILAPSKEATELFVGGLQRETTERSIMGLLQGKDYS